MLARAFLARFFENDITGGSSDLRTSFFWLLAFLAVPGTFVPFLMMFNWEGYALMHGAGGLAIAARGAKVFYIGYAMVASGLISAITWSSLLLDTRDALVVGPLPVPGGLIVRAKLTALCVYIVMVAVITHALASMSYGLLLAARGTLAWAVSGAIAHMVASCAATSFVLFAVTAIQGLILALAGPRRFLAVSPWLQSGLVAVGLLGLLFLPTISSATVDTLAGRDPDHAWILRTPPLWFLGLYEMILRNVEDAPLTSLGITALVGLAGTAALTLVTYPLAYRRMVSAVTEMTPAIGGRTWIGQAIGRLVVTLAGRDSVSRSAAQFLLTTMRRSLRHRIAVAIAAGITIAIVSPTIFRWAPHLRDLPPTPPIDLLALPLVVMTFTLIGVRLAAALPADLQSGWMLDGIGASRRAMRAGVWRTMFWIVVVPVCLLTMIGAWRAWGVGVAAPHVCVSLALGIVEIEALLWGFDAFPCSRPWRPERAQLRKLWPAYLVGFIFVVRLLPMLERRRNFAAWPWIVASFAIVTILLRVTHRRRPISTDDDADQPQVQLLNLGG